MERWIILIGSKATPMERMAAAELAADITSVTGRQTEVREESRDLPDNCIITGCPATSFWVDEFHRNGRLGLKELKGNSEGGSIDLVTLPGGRKVLVLAGIDPMGTQYMLGDFATEELGVDPCAFWTGSAVKAHDSFAPLAVSPRVLHCPFVPIRCYFDNDNDELANLDKPYLEIDYRYWEEIIKTLVRMKYNAIDFHDHLGRVEYVTRAPYLKLRPGYKVNVELLNRIMDYAKLRGLMIQTSFYLGWEFKAIGDEAAHNWRDHKVEWLETWRYYLQETPIGRSDIFLSRPRDQKLDHPYRSSCGERVADVFNEAFPQMKDIIRAHNPDAIIIVDLYSEGVGVYHDGFRPQPPEDYVLSWPDNGFGAFSQKLVDLNPYRAGIYMHAGYWLNHVVADPCPELLEKSMKEAFQDYGMRHYCLVNGQTFRHYLLNIEACARLCWDPQNFSSGSFLKAWISRYFGAAPAGRIEEILALLHDAQEGGNGYVQLLAIISEWQRPPMPERRCTGKWARVLMETEARVTILEKAQTLCRAVQETVDDSTHVFHDQLALPLMLLLEINCILRAVLLVPEAPDPQKALSDANDLITQHTARREKGDRDTRWQGWYSPATARPNGGYPRLEFF